jgi:hypothetical protein
MTTVSSVLSNCAGGIRAKMIGIDGLLDVRNLVLVVGALIPTRDAPIPLCDAFRACKFPNGDYCLSAQS